MASKTNLTKKHCLDWIVNKYKGKEYNNNKKNENYKKYELLCAIKNNIEDLTNLHLYFNDNNLLRSIYKQLAFDYGFCFLHNIIIKGTHNNFKLYILSKNNHELFNPETYITEEVQKCKNKMFAIPFGTPLHMNMLIINTKNETVEHFEPHGKEFIGDYNSNIT